MIPGYMHLLNLFYGYERPTLLVVPLNKELITGCLSSVVNAFSISLSKDGSGLNFVQLLELLFIFVKLFL